VPVLQPKQRKTDERDQHVGIEDDPGVSGREIAGREHLVEMTARRPEQEQRRADHGGESEIEAVAEREEADHRKAEAGKTHLRLKRAVRPTDEARCHRAEEGVAYEFVEKGEADREQQEIREQWLDYDPRAVSGFGARSSAMPDAISPRIKKVSVKVAQDEADEGFHASARVSRSQLNFLAVPCAAAHATRRTAAN
jgi:hypothetical protein